MVFSYGCYQVNNAMQEMVKTVYPEALGARRAKKAKAVATKDFQAVLLSDSSEDLDPALMQVGGLC